MRPTPTSHNRHGAAVAEMAICLPFVILMVVGSIELSSGLFHQMVFRAAVHECATLAADGSSSSDHVQTLANQILNQHDVTDFTITIDEVTRTVNSGTVSSNPIAHFDIPATGTTTAGLDTVPRGTLLKMRLFAPRPPATGLGVISKYLDSQISAECVFVKEL